MMTIADHTISAHAALTIGLSAALLTLVGCTTVSGVIPEEERLSLGEEAELVMEPDGERFLVAVDSVDEAASDVVDQFENTDTIYYVHLTTSYQGSNYDSSKLDPAAHVAARLSDGTYLKSDFIGMAEAIPDCPGPETEDYRAAVATGNPTGVCVPVSVEPGTELTGVFVSSDGTGDNGIEWAFP